MGYVKPFCKSTKRLAAVLILLAKRTLLCIWLESLPLKMKDWLKDATVSGEVAEVYAVLQARPWDIWGPLGGYLYSKAEVDAP